jgi:DNA phosphorothioation-dependent restriction protein DptF
VKLIEALGVLSRSSKYSVSTLRTESTIDTLQELKDQIYITPEIQNDFSAALSKATPKDIFCLCGSSGDGKSEILTQLYKEFNQSVDFHLDATHSKSQHKSAIDNLDEKFDDFKVSDKPLAIGINIGMLQKFIKQGDKRHNDIKKSFEQYFDNRHVKAFKTGNTCFYDFECYPRLQFSSQKITSEFISKFLNKLTEKTESNPFWKYYQLEGNTPSQVKNNFDILSLKSFQNRLIELFGIARLIEEQFLIPRTFVDFIYQILTKENEDGIIGNVFTKFDNEFSHSFAKIDPISKRSRDIDSFYLEYATNTLSKEIQSDIDLLTSITKVSLTSQGIIQGCYLLRDEEFTSQLANFSSKSYLQKSLTNYLILIELFEKEVLSDSDEDDYVNIVEDLLISSALDYANRLLPSRVDGYIVSRKIQSFSICNKVNVHADVDWVEKYELLSKDIIPISLIINDEPPYVFNVDLKTMIQAVSISNGFRPNRQNLEVIAKFDELITHIVQGTIETDSMKLIGPNKTISVNKNRRRYSVGA